MWLGLNSELNQTLTKFNPNQTWGWGLILNLTSGKLGGFSVVCGFIREMQVPVTGKVSLCFRHNDTACICKRIILGNKIDNEFDGM